MIMKIIDLIGANPSLFGIAVVVLIVLAVVVVAAMADS